MQCISQFSSCAWKEEKRTKMLLLFQKHFFVILQRFAIAKVLQLGHDQSETRPSESWEFWMLWGQW